MEKRLYKLALFEEAVTQGLASTKDFRAAFPMGHDVSKEVMARWLAKFRTVDASFSQTRFVNRFCLGADPEFIFSTPDGDRMDASSLRLKQGLAFGSDNNGRLAEIRPHPNRSALHVCASILATMRWMLITRPATQKYQWQCGPYLQQDGLGGHVHFGRKRPTRTDEIRALDKVNELLMGCNIYRQAEIDARQHGDARGQRYGIPGDYRMQKHGYEYRTYPSWLDSPMLAFLVITLSKLAVHNPTLVNRIRQVGQPLPHLFNLCLYYKDIDDDARIASVLLHRYGMPRHIGGDFKGRWGLGTVNAKGADEIVLPSSIPASATEVKELFDHLLTGASLALPEAIAPTWKCSALPKGFRPCIELVNTTGRKGLGETIWDLCYNAALPITFVSRQLEDRKQCVRVSSNLASQLPLDWKRSGMQAGSPLETTDEITLNSYHLHEPYDKQLREMILCGSFPIWDIRTVKEDSFTKWRTRCRQGERKFHSSIVYQQGKPIL